MPENSPHNAEVFKNTREFIIVPKVPKKQMLKSLPPNTEEQTPENLSHNAEGVQKQTPENSSQFPSAKGQIPENSPPNAKGVQELISIKLPHSAKSAKGQNAREFTIQCQSAQEQMLENSHNAKRIHYIVPKVPKDKLMKNSLHKAEGQMPENSPHNAKGVQDIKEQTSESSPHNAKSVHAQRIHNVKDAQEQIPEDLQWQGQAPESSYNVKYAQGQF
ncbi:44478_t:CDS:2 [Gigaspora margarita]|uniref:44478_t:CDS:1 n=1 Tax=Gigaspora margarita TaxID=4874 RepID=A0ABN7UWU2_GIGMA|nr:44478_t:CDS:2 [Gigaspora margarita]